MTYMSKKLREQLKGSVRSTRRATIYKILEKQNNGTVPCYVCGNHVKKGTETLEHILPVSRGGTDEMDNLSISHLQCNQRRGSNDICN